MMNLINLKLFLTYLISKKRTLNIDEGKKKVIVALAANYGNLGDVAITKAQLNFLQEQYPQRLIIPFYISETFTNLKSLKAAINEDDIITIVGGGNLGNLYPDIEYARQLIIRKFPKNKIIIFPQSIYFNEGKDGLKSLKKCSKVYGKHKELTLCIRDKFSKEKYGKYFSCSQKVIPDIVFSMKPKVNSASDRNGTILCLRSDQEGNISDQARKLISEYVEKKNTVINYDTHVGNISDVNLLNKALENILKSFSEAQLVITDRMHGMVFSYITDTPCIVISHNSYKIQGCYDWIKEANFIKIYNEEDYENNSELYQIIDELLCFNQSQIRKVDLESKFEELKEII